MKLIYINDELATGDGSNSHAVGFKTKSSGGEISEYL